MSTKHTPGPWQAERSATNERWQIKGNRLVLVQHTFDGEEAAANAKLIAAAPDLIEACERSLLYLSAKYPKEAEILHQLKSAIQKATS